MSPKRIKAINLIESIHAESNKNFGCINHQFISERLEAELIEHFVLKTEKKTDKKKVADKIRNLNILKEFIFHGFNTKITRQKYKDLRMKYGLTSVSAIHTICKRTAISLSSIVKFEIDEGLPPKRIINMYGIHLIDLIDKKLELLNNQK